MSKSCAYCGEAGPFTKEHIFPAFLYNILLAQKFGYQPQSDKFITSEPTIKDVCSKCNNGNLSKLDAYAKHFIGINQCERVFSKKSKHRLVYDFHLLQRWLLKVSYNAMRANNYDKGLISQMVPYIMYGSEPPIFNQLAVEIVLNQELTAVDRKSLRNNSNETKDIEPRFLRTGNFIQVSSDTHLFRFIAINAFYFYSIVGNEPRLDKSISEILKEIPSKRYSLSPSKVTKEVKTSSRTILDVYTDEGLRRMPAWKRQFGS